MIRIESGTDPTSRSAVGDGRHGPDNGHVHHESDTCCLWPPWESHSCLSRDHRGILSTFLRPSKVPLNGWWLCGGGGLD